MVVEEKLSVRRERTTSNFRMVTLVFLAMALSMPVHRSRVEAFSVKSPYYNMQSTTHHHARRIFSGLYPPALYGSSSSSSSSTSEDEISFDSLIDMDVVIYSKKDDDSSTKLFGAIQEDGSLAPISAWTTEPAFGDSLEFLVDEEDRFSLKIDQLRLHYLLQESEMSYGSRQCHRGVGNPHGEESELLYYVEQSVIEKFDVQIEIKPDLEILW